MYRTSDALIRNVHSQVADRVGISIVRGDVGVGETLPSEMQICEMMDVSRTVVREAIRTLTGKGLVEARPKSGTRVRPPEQWNQLDPDVLRWRLETSDMDSYLTKLFQLRCAVEPAAAALAATSAREGDIARIRAGYEGMAAAKVNEQFVVADIAFHQAIYFATRNPEAAREATDVLLKNSADDLVRIRGREFASRRTTPATPSRDRG